MGAGISSFFSDDSARRRSTHVSRYGSRRYSRKSTVDTCAQEAQEALAACKARRATRKASVKPPPVNSTPSENTSEQFERFMNETARRPMYVPQPQLPVETGKRTMPFIAPSVQQRSNGRQRSNGYNRTRFRTMKFNPTPTNKRNPTTPNIFEDD